MTRPPSIRAFERFYLTSTALYVANAALFWGETREAMRSLPYVASSPLMAPLIGPIMVGALVVTVLVSLLLWYLVARAGNAVGKWGVVATEAIGAAMGAMALLGLLQGASPYRANVALGLLVTALAVAAAVMLFRPDATAWFRDEAAEVEGPRA